MASMPNYVVELLQFLDSELSRFWTRFNIFVALQIGAIAGFAKLAEVLKNSDADRRAVALRFSLLLMTLVSLVGAIAIMRGHDLQQALVKTIRELYPAPEADGGSAAEQGPTNGDQTPSFGPNVIDKVDGNDFLPPHISTITASVFAWICAIMWPLAWLWLATDRFNIAVEPVTGSEAPNSGERRPCDGGAGAPPNTSKTPENRSIASERTICVGSVLTLACAAFSGIVIGLTVQIWSPSTAVVVVTAFFALTLVGMQVISESWGVLVFLWAQLTGRRRGRNA